MRDRLDISLGHRGGPSAAVPSFGKALADIVEAEDLVPVSDTTPRLFSTSAPADDLPRVASGGARGLQRFRLHDV